MVAAVPQHALRDNEAHPYCPCPAHASTTRRRYHRPFSNPLRQLGMTSRWGRTHRHHQGRGITTPTITGGVNSIITNEPSLSAQTITRFFYILQSARATSVFPTAVSATARAHSASSPAERLPSSISARFPQRVPSHSNWPSETGPPKSPYRDQPTRAGTFELAPPMCRWAISRTSGSR